MKASDVLSHCRLKQGTARPVTILAIWRAADDGGIIQADTMVRFFPGRPTLHQPTEVADALVLAGCQEAATNA